MRGGQQHLPPFHRFSSVRFLGASGHPPLLWTGSTTPLRPPPQLNLRRSGCFYITLNFVAITMSAFSSALQSSPIPLDSNIFPVNSKNRVVLPLPRTFGESRSNIVLPSVPTIPRVSHSLKRSKGYPSMATVSWSAILGPFLSVLPILFLGKP